MDPHDFTIWLSGMVAGRGDAVPTPEQWAEIRRRLAEVEKAGIVHMTYDVAEWGGPVWPWSKGDKDVCPA